jgi:hypothetical protein
MSETTIEFVQDGTGGRVVTAWPASGKWSMGVAFVLSTATNAEDHVAVRAKSDGSWYGYGVESMS